MSMVVAHNLSALRVQRWSAQATRRMAGSLRRLSSGYRINTGAEGPADLIISEKLRAQTVGLERAIRNSQEASNLLGIAEGALHEVSNVLRSMRSLALHAANDGITSPEQIAADQAELDSGIATIDRIANTTSYAGDFLLNGDQSVLLERRASERHAGVPLVDLDGARVDQIPFRNYQLFASFAGSDAPDASGRGDAIIEREARKAYLELDSAAAGLDVTGGGAQGAPALSEDQAFVLGGTAGSHAFSFERGATMGQIAETINSQGERLGAEASLIFNSEQSVDMVAYSTAPDITNHGVLTSGDAGTIETFSAVTGVQGASGAVNTNDRVDTFTVRASQVAGDQVLFELVDDLGNTLDSTTEALAATGVVPDVGTHAVSLNSGNGTLIDFDYHYYYSEPAGVPTWERPAGDLAEFDHLAAVTDLGVTTANVGDSFDNVTSVATGANDLIGDSFYVTANAGPQADEVTFRLFNNLGNLVGGPTTYNLPATAELDTASQAVSIATANGTNVSFDYHYECDPNKGPLGSYDSVTGTMAVIDRNGNVTWTNPNTTGGPFGGAVTAPTPPQNAAQGIAATVSIFDVVNGETPFTVNATAGAAPGEMTFDLVGGSGVLDSETLVLPTLATAGTGSQAVSFSTPNGSTVSFTYRYENDPSTGEFDRPTGALFDVGAQVIDSERLFNGLDPAAAAAGAAVDVNLDASDPGHLRNLQYGRNTDGQGRIFIHVTEHDSAANELSFELYRDRSRAPDALVGRGSGVSDGSAPIEIEAANGSQLAGQITFDDNGGAVDFEAEFQDDAYLAVGGIQAENGVAYDGLFASAPGAGAFDLDRTSFSGVALGRNTDGEGRVFFKVQQTAPDRGHVYAYRDERLRDQDLVAATDGAVSLAANEEVILNEVTREGEPSGLGVMLYTDAAWGGGAGAVHVGEARFTNLGVRVSAAAYGSEEYLSINQTEGRCWQYYADPDSAAATVVDPEQGTRRVHGGDARINLNGERKRCRGLSLELATTEMTGALAFHAGKVGATTVAQVGYSDGSIFTNAAFLTNVSDGWVDSNGDGLRNSNETTTFKGGAHLVNAGTSMKETLGFQGGMQLQLGEGAGTQERTVMGLPSVAVATLGRTEAEDGAGRIALGDLIGGGAASLATDPIQALQVIDAAITEVAETRARIGAWQKNLLATNVNSLEVAVEKTTSTESYIRDANMAAESIDFTRNQIISRSSTAMLAQANVQARRVLRLLRR